LDAILSGPGHVRLLRALLAHGGPLSAARLAQETRLTPNGVRGVLYDLQRTGVVAIIGSGRSRLFQAIPGQPLVRALTPLFVAERERFDAMLNCVKVATADSRIVSVWLFGSVARWEDAVDSDVDIAIVVHADGAETDEVSDWVRNTLIEHGRKLGFSISLTSMSSSDVERLRSENAPLWSDLLRDACVLKGSSLKAAVKLSAPP
jgi:predicted nucleotidyltransferase